MRKQDAMKIGFGMLIMACAFLSARPARATMTQRCNWGVTPYAPTVQPASTQVIMMPTVMDFGGPPLGTSKVAFISFATANQANIDGGGVLRIIDGNCNELARFPDPTSCPILPATLTALGCPSTLVTSPDLAPASGLAVGNINTTPDVEIIAVIGGGSVSHKQIVAFILNAGCLKPVWCSQPLPTGDSIPSASAPAIAQLDKSGTAAASQSEIIIDNKVFDANGAVRYTGFSVGGNNCASMTGGAPCPRSRAAVVANLSGGVSLPQLITGRGIYNGGSLFWTGTLGPMNTAFNNSSLVYPAVAELDSNSPGPEIAVTDTMNTTLRVLSASGVTLASTLLPNPSSMNPKCGGPPMIGNADGFPGPEIGVASCTRYTLFKYNPGGTLTQVWSKPTNDPGGQTTSTLVNTPTGARIYYTDAFNITIFNGSNGNVIQTVPNTSATSIEGPVIAAFDNGPTLARVVVAANNYYMTGGQKGIRIFDDPAIGPARSYWNQHSYHVTNVMSSFGAIPTVEPPNWLNPARNTYRAQQ